MFNLIFDENNYIISTFYDEEGIYNLPDNFDFYHMDCYYLKDNNIILDKEKLQETIRKEQEEASKPSRLDQIEAQSIFTALATDTLLEV